MLQQIKAWFHGSLKYHFWIMKSFKEGYMLIIILQELILVFLWKKWKSVFVASFDFYFKFDFFFIISWHTLVFFERKWNGVYITFFLTDCYSKVSCKTISLILSHFHVCTFHCVCVCVCVVFQSKICNFRMALSIYDWLNAFEKYVKCL